MPINNKRGNSSRRKQHEEERKSLAGDWATLRRKGPFSGSDKNVYENAQSFDLSLSADDLRAALDYMAAITGDKLFSSAALAMKGYRLKGGLKDAIKRMLRDCGLTGADAVVPFVRNSSAAELERVTVKYGVPAPSFDTAVDYVKRAYRRSRDKSSVVPQMPDGNTGEKLVIRLVPTFDQAGKPVRECLGVQFDSDWFGIAPNTREWRRMIRIGSASLHAVAEKAPKKEPKAPTAEEALNRARLIEFSRDKLSK